MNDVSAYILFDKGVRLYKIHRWYYVLKELFEVCSAFSSWRIFTFLFLCLYLWIYTIFIVYATTTYGRKCYV
jgi:hypothetical protein